MQNCHPRKNYFYRQKHLQRYQNHFDLHNYLLYEAHFAEYNSRCQEKRDNKNIYERKYNKYIFNLNNREVTYQSILNRNGSCHKLSSAFVKVSGKNSKYGKIYSNEIRLFQYI